jgi:hypothetical protein
MRKTSEEKKVSTPVSRFHESGDPVLGPLSVREDDMMSEEITSDQVKGLLSETGNSHALDTEDYSGTLEVYKENGDFFYKLIVQQHDGPDWGKKTMGETDTSHSASNSVYRGEVPEDTDVYEEARKAEEGRF